MIMVRGDVAAVMASVQAGVAAAGGLIVNTFIIPNLHESIFPAIYGTNKVDRRNCVVSAGLALPQTQFRKDRSQTGWSQYQER